MLHIYRDDVPAHRVVNRNGLQENSILMVLISTIVRNEGIVVVENQIIDFEKHFLGTNPVLVSQLMGYLINWQSFILE
jgi:alkylated DNA nucleotide flippase Atl1